MIAFLKPTTLAPSLVCTVIVLAEENAASPVTTCTLRALARPDKPPVSFLMMLSFQPRSASISISGADILTPKCAISSASVITLAACSKALEGMQPTFRQTPPSDAYFSISTTFWPRSAARNAAV